MSDTAEKPLAMLTPRLSLIAALAAISVAASLTSAPALAQVPPGTTDAPVLSDATPRGSNTLRDLVDVVPTLKSIDGDISDWQGQSSMYGGTALYSAGEFVYQDHIFDSYGPDDGRDAERLANTAPLGPVPGAYRVESLAQADAIGEALSLVGLVDAPEQLQTDDTYGDARTKPYNADILETRVAEQNGNVALLVRTTTMTDRNQTGVLVLADTDGIANSEAPMPFNAGVHSEAADVAFFLSGSSGWAFDMATETLTPLPDGSVSTNESDYDNAIEALIPGELVGTADGQINIAVATGNSNGQGFADLELDTNSAGVAANLANVAFRFDEPVRIWFEQAQALSLFGGSIDDYFTDIDLASLQRGLTQALTPGPGYHDRLFLSGDNVARESGQDGRFQHYGLYIPQGYDPAQPAPLQWWLHWRGGSAHSAGAVVPRVFEHFGEHYDTIVVAPSARSSSSWYVGKGQVDFLEVWNDVFENTGLIIDRDRVYVTGHSMGGWGSYLMALMYPDRFAAVAPVAGPVTIGLWSGLDFEGCDEFTPDDGETTPCYVAQNGSRPRIQHTRRLLENARHVPIGILQGAEDELVWVTGVSLQADRLRELNFRYRYFVYPAHEHYSHPIFDQWTEAAKYLHTFERDPNPAHVTYIRDMPFEIAAEEVQAQGGKTHDFDFNSAYWMSNLEPVDETDGVASFDGRSLAIAEEPQLVVPEAGGPTAPGTTGPYFYEGLAWLKDPLAEAPATSNEFIATLTGAAKVQFDLGRMSIDTSKLVRGTVTTDSPLTLRLKGYSSVPEVVIGATVDSLDGDVLVLQVPAGTTTLSIDHLSNSILP